MNQEKINLENTALQNYISNEEEKFIKSLLREIEPTLEETPLKTMEQALHERAENLKYNFEKARADFARGFDLYLQKLTEEEREQFFRIFLKLRNLAVAAIKKDAEEKVEALTVKDLEFLQEIAKKELSSNNNEEAGVMFRLIIHINPFYSPAWIGWAVAEYEQKNLDVVNQIYELGLSCMPDDLLLPVFAARFHILTNNRMKARELLEKAQEQAIAHNDEEAMLEIKSLLAMV